MAFLKSAETLKLEGVKHLKKGDFKKALDRFKRANKKKPRDVNILSYLSQAQLGVSDLDAALKTIDEAIVLDPNNLVHHQLKATYLMRKGAYEEAKAVIEHCITIQPGDVAYLMRGQVDFNLRDYDAAEEWFDKALGIDPENPLSNQMKGLVLFYKKQYADAIPYLELSMREGETEMIQKILEECKRNS